MAVKLPDGSMVPNPREPQYPDQISRPDDAQRPVPSVNLPRKAMTCDQIEAELDRQGAKAPKTEMPPPAGPSTATKEAPRQFADDGEDKEPDDDDVNMAKYDWDKCVADQIKKGHSKDAAERICGAIRAGRN